MTASYTEESLVEQPAIEIFKELGWASVSALEESFGSAKPSPRPAPGGRGSWLGRETKSEVVLIPKVRAALERLNPALPSDAINSAVNELVLGLSLPPLLSKLIDLKAKDIAK